MKRKLFSLVAAVMAMSMTTSAFAATARGTGDVDGDSQLTANDVMAIVNSLTDSAEANVDGSSNGINGADANVLYNIILQPKTVTEDLELRVYTENYSVGATPAIAASGAANLGSSVADNEQGMGIVDDTVSLTSGTTISEAINQLANVVTDSSAASISEQLDKIYFNSATKGDVYLRHEDGWAMFCWAVRAIVPLSESDAQLINKASDAATAEEIAAKQDQVDAMNNIKALVVSNNTLTAADIQTIKDEFLKAFPNTITSDEVTAAAADVLSITGDKYVFTANGEEITTTSSFVTTLAAFMPGWQDKTIADYRNAFTDKLEITAQNVKANGEVIKGIIEVAVTAEVR